MGGPVNQLLGKKVYASDGSYRGEVIETVFMLGSGEPMLILRTDSPNPVEVPWGKVAAAKDILILADDADVSSTTQARAALTEPQVRSPPSGATGEPEPTVPAGRMLGRFGKSREAVVCPKCGKPAKWIKQYGRWYCYRDREYV